MTVPPLMVSVINWDRFAQKLSLSISAGQVRYFTLVQPASAIFLVTRMLEGNTTVSSVEQPLKKFEGISMGLPVMVRDRRCVVGT